MTIELLVSGQGNIGIERFDCSKHREEIRNAISADQLELCEMLIDNSGVGEW